MSLLTLYITCEKIVCNVLMETRNAPFFLENTANALALNFEKYGGKCKTDQKQKNIVII
jgi:hypothetical protein